jgi:CHAD domain-containing protein
MLTRGRLHKFLRKRCHDIRRHVKDYCVRQDPEALHLLRVEVKKLKALAYLLQNGTQHHHLQISGLKKVYRLAGEIRTVEVNKKILEELELENKEFEEEQQQTLKDASEAFCQHASRYQHNIHRVEHHLEKNLEPIRSEKVRTFFQQGIEKLALFFSAAVMDVDALHSARKEVKNLMYLHALLPASLSASLGLDTTYLDNLQTRLGNWHDKVVTLSLLKTMDDLDTSLVQQLERSCAASLQEVRELACDFNHKVRSSDLGKTSLASLSERKSIATGETVNT